MNILLIYLPAFLVLLTILVFVHEFGHYWIARRCGVRVEVFSIGFGSEVFGWTDRAKTRWKFSAIPLGGYIRMFGEGPYSAGGAPISEADKAQSFAHKSLMRRAAIVFAGPAANLIFAVLVLTLLFMIKGQVERPTDITALTPGSAAEAAGLLPGDRFHSINGTPIGNWREMSRMIRPNPGKPLNITVYRDGRTVTVVAVPQSKEVMDRAGEPTRIGFLGVFSGPGKRVGLGPYAAFLEASRESVEIAGFTLTAIGEMIVGKREITELGGPVRIGQLSGDHARRGVMSFVILVALLSINLGLINLFPIPMLDGGHLVFYGIEAIRGKPLAQNVQLISVRIGLVLLLAFMLFVTVNDLVNLPVYEFFKSLVI